jgi:hypothetical protein
MSMLIYSHLQNSTFFKLKKTTYITTKRDILPENENV